MKIKEALIELKNGNCRGIQSEFTRVQYILNKKGEAVSIDGRDKIPNYYTTGRGPRGLYYVGEWSLLFKEAI